MAGVKFFLQGIQSLEKVFFDFLVGIDNLPGISVNLSPEQKELVNARAEANSFSMQQARFAPNRNRNEIAASDKRVAAAEAALANTGVQVAIDFIAEFTKGIEAARLVPPSGAGPGAPFPLNFADSPQGKAAAKAAAESAKAAAKASEDAASRVAGLQPTNEKARITFLKDIAAVNVTIADAEANAAAARKGGDADAIKAAEDRLSLTYEQAGLAVQIANENRKEKDMAALKARDDLTKQADEIKNTLKFDLASPSRKALIANDVRTSAGASQVASFRRMEDDPALDEAKAATKKLEEIKQKLDALNREPVDML